MYHRYRVFFWMLTFGLVSGAEGRNFRVNLLPNGSANRCSNCHISSNGGGARTPFGEAVNVRVTQNGRQQFWTPALAQLDSDGDGSTNGEELGDPDGDGTPTPGAEVTNPGDANSKPQPVNSAPVFASIAAQAVKEGETFTFSVDASDPDKDRLTYKTGILPTGASFSGTSFSWTPDFDQGGQSYQVSFTVSDGAEDASMSVQVTVEDVNRPVSLSAIAPDRGLVIGAPGDTLRFSVSAVDPDGDPVTFAWTANGASLAETGDSYLLTVSSGDLDDLVSVSVSSGEGAVVQTWAVGKTLMGDFNGDRNVNFADFLDFANAFGKTSAEPDFNTVIDLDKSGQIDFPDFLEFVRYFGLSIP